MDWLQALLVVNKILLKVISGKTVIVILEQRLSQCYLIAELELCNIVAYTLALGNNHETVIIVPSWSYDNHTVKIFDIVPNIIVNTVIIMRFADKYYT